MDRRYLSSILSSLRDAAPYLVGAAVIGGATYAAYSYATRDTQSVEDGPQAAHADDHITRPATRQPSNVHTGGQPSTATARSTSTTSQTQPTADTETQTTPHITSVPSSTPARDTRRRVSLQNNAGAVDADPHEVSASQPMNTARRASQHAVTATHTDSHMHMPTAASSDDTVRSRPSVASTPARAPVIVQDATPVTSVMSGLRSVATPVHDGIVTFAERMTTDQVALLLTLCCIIIALYVFNALTARIAPSAGAGDMSESLAFNSNAGMGSLGWGLLGLVIGAAMSKPTSENEDMALPSKNRLAPPAWEPEDVSPDIPAKLPADIPPQRQPHDAPHARAHVQPHELSVPNAVIHGAAEMPDAAAVPQEPSPLSSSGIPDNTSADDSAAEIVTTAPLNAHEGATLEESSADAAAAADEESVPEGGDLTVRETQILNRYIRAIDAAEKENNSQQAAALIDRALTYLNAPGGGALKDLPDAQCTLVFSSAALGRQYELSYPLLPSSRLRLLSSLLWRRARNCMLRASAMRMAGQEAAAQPVMEQGLEAALASLAQYEEDADAHKYAGILYAKAAKDTKEKIAAAYKIRDHTIRAISIRPNDPVLHHILGVWHYEVSSLGWIQRQLASALFGTPPSSTYQEALNSLLRSEQLASAEGGVGAMMSTRLKLAQTYLALGNKAQATKWITSSFDVPVGAGEDQDDLNSQVELAKKLGVKR